MRSPRRSRPATVDLQGLQHLVDDAAFVRQIVAQEQMPRKATFWRPDARLVFLGGPAVTATSGWAGPAGAPHAHGALDVLSAVAKALALGGVLREPLDARARPLDPRQ